MRTSLSRDATADAVTNEATRAVESRTILKGVSLKIVQSCLKCSGVLRHASNPSKSVVRANSGRSVGAEICCSCCHLGDRSVAPTPRTRHENPSSAFKHILRLNSSQTTLQSPGSLASQSAGTRLLLSSNRMCSGALDSETRSASAEPRASLSLNLTRGAQP